MLTQEERSQIVEIVDESLDRAEAIWNQVEEEMLLEKYAALSARMVTTLIPEFPEIDSRRPKVDGFVALVLDIRDSTKHMKQLGPKSQPQKEQRVLYETFALLPACSRALEYEKGRTTEYLGDGILGLFYAPVGDEQKREAGMRRSLGAAWKCFEVRKIVNQKLADRYGLPALDMGIGLSWSNAVVTVVGLPGNLHPKVLGECVFDASKGAGGRNEIWMDERTYGLWPKAEGGGGFKPYFGSPRNADWPGVRVPKE